MYGMVTSTEETPDDPEVKVPMETVWVWLPWPVLKLLEDVQPALLPACLTVVCAVPWPVLPERARSRTLDRIISCC
jgi:hypothetical protein